MSASVDITGALSNIREQLAEAVAAAKCHSCGCLHQTVEALSRTEAGASDLAEDLRRARAVFVPKKYDCLGCAVCYPAIAANAFAEVFPEDGARLDLCPVEPPAERAGWPPLPGSYHVVRYAAPVAVCTLDDAPLAERLSATRADGLSIAGTMQTENLGIERLIRNVLANPHIRFLVLCGEEARQAVGHLPGQSLASLFADGLDASGRIRGAKGRRPVLRNVTADDVRDFVRQVELVPMIGETADEAVLRAVRACASRDPGPSSNGSRSAGLRPLSAVEPRRLVLDPAGYFVVYPDARRGLLVTEHYTNDGVLGTVLEGSSPAAVASTAVERGLLTRLDHAAYLGRELARAEISLQTGAPYVQDAAPGSLDSLPDVPALPSAPATSCGCGPTCR